MSPTKTIIDPSHELKAIPNLPELDTVHEYPELSGYDGYLMELETMLHNHDKL